MFAYLVWLHAQISHADLSYAHLQSSEVRSLRQLQCWQKWQTMMMFRFWNVKISVTLYFVLSQQLQRLCFNVDFLTSFLILPLPCLARQLNRKLFCRSLAQSEVRHEAGVPNLFHPRITNYPCIIRFSNTTKEKIITIIFNFFEDPKLKKKTFYQILFYWQPVTEELLVAQMLFPPTRFNIAAYVIYFVAEFAAHSGNDRLL